MGWLIDLIVRLFSEWLNKTPTPIAEAEKVGTATQAAKDANARADAESRIAQAEANAPTSIQGVEDRLSKGTF